MKLALQILVWTALLIGGVWVISAVTASPGAGGGSGVGRFSYWFKYTLEPDPSRTSEDEIIGRVTIEGKAPARFLVDGRISPVYQEVRMEWVMFLGVAGSETEGSCSVDLIKNEITSGSAHLPLDSDGLRALFGLVVTSEQSAQFLDGVLSRLQTCRSGTMPRPRHHTYYFDDPPVRGRLQHFALGAALNLRELVWAGIWFLLVVAAAIIKRRNTEAQRTGHPLCV